MVRGSSERVGLPLSYAPEYILAHDDENIDLVAYLLNPPPDRYDYLHISQDYFTDIEILQKNNIRTSSNVFFAGLFYKFAMEGEQMKLAHLYVVECQSIDAFSGSPVFFEVDRISDTRTYSKPEIYLGGVIKGHYNDLIENPSGYIREINAGLALVTPCYFLNELLHTRIIISCRYR